MAFLGINNLNFGVKFKQYQCFFIAMFLGAIVFGTTASVIVVADDRIVPVNVDQYLIVDCLLPGKVKQLGLNRTYLGRKRPLKTSAQDCAIRGGEYVTYDRADLGSAVRVWEQAAQTGDPQAQYYLGEIYELGVAQNVDYEKAFYWYQKAAESDYAPAQLSLGRMYERGEYVEKNLVKAINLYRLASGLNDDEIAYASVFEALGLEDKKTIQDLRDRISDKDIRIDDLLKEIESLRRQLSQTNQRVRELQRQEYNLDSQVSSMVTESGMVTTIAYDQALHQQRLIYADIQKKHESIHLLQELVKTESDSTIVNALQQNIKFAKHQVSQNERIISQQEKKALNLQQELWDLKRRVLQASVDKKTLDDAYQYVVRLLQQEKQELKNRLMTSKHELNNHLSPQLVLDQRKMVAIAEQQIALIEIKLNHLEQAAPQQSNIDVVKVVLDEREQHYQHQVEWLSKQLSLQSNQINYLSEQLRMLESTSNQDKQKVVLLERLLSEESDVLIERTQNLAQKTNSLLQANATIKRLENDLYQRPTVMEVRGLENQLQQIRQKLSQAQNKNVALMAQFDKTKLSLSNKAETLNVFNEKPVIAVKWPEVTARSQDLVKEIEVAAGGSVNIVGGVRSMNAISSFLINDEVEDLDIHGLFLKSVAVANSPVQLVLKAIDAQGLTTQSTIILKPSKGLSIQPLANQRSIDFGRYHALVIGNDNYTISNGFEPLKTAVHDAKDVAKVLREQYDFEVTLALDLQRHEMLLELEKMRKKLTDKDNLLIYYAGHGVIDPENDQGYWIPVDGALDSAVNWVSNATITDQIRAMSARNIMVIADSCYSASLMRSGVVTLRSGLSADKKRQRLLEDIRTNTRVALSSGGLQPVADSIANSQHSVFTGAMLEVLRDNTELLDADSLATTVGHRVSVATSNTVKQVPRFAPLSHGGHQGGEFYFAPKQILNSFK